jgi:dTDP-4-dehydrorhamnose reductase
MGQHEMRIIITGGTGLLGKSLIETCEPRHEIVATYIGGYNMEDCPQFRYRRLDIRDHIGHAHLLEGFSPDVIIHTAGIGSPDYAEQHTEESWEINIGGTRNILSLCEKYNAKLIYISSNGIYDGEKAPYGEEDMPEPINYYGMLKLEGEKLLAKAKIPCSIVRPILMYGWNHVFERHNIATYAISKITNGEQVQVYDDIFVTPLFSHSCAKAIWKIIEKEKYDIFNIAGADRVSIYQLLGKVAEIFDLDANLIKPVQQGFFNEWVKRPKDTSFKTDKMEKELDLKPLSLDEGLRLMKEIRQ